MVKTLSGAPAAAQLCMIGVETSSLALQYEDERRQQRTAMIVVGSSQFTLASFESKMPPSMA